MTATKFYLKRIRVNQGGYDAMGGYWGIGMPVYHAEAEDPNGPELHFRAMDRDDAKDYVRARHPDARFFR